jgi:large subunit ribosomal protein L30e
MVDIDKVLKNVIKKGKVKIGVRQTKMMMKEGSAMFVVMSNNCPSSSEIKELASKKKIQIYNYNANSIELGYICGKTFGVSVLAVLDDGGSNILQLTKKR